MSFFCDRCVDPKQLENLLIILKDYGVSLRRFQEIDDCLENGSWGRI